MPQNIGQELNEIWGVHSSHALYSKDGKRFHRLKKFPGALFPLTGYVLFKTEEEYLHCSDLNIKDNHTYCSKGISLIPNYIQVISTIGQASDLAEPVETKRTLNVVNRIIRDIPLARQIKNLHGNKCQVCQQTLMFFGTQIYAEAHHIKPLGSDHHGPDVAENIICVCPNCHAQLDYGAIELSKTTLNIISGHHIKDEYINYHNTVIYKGSISPLSSKAISKKRN